MNKRHVLKLLSSYLDRELSEKENQKVEQHLKTCPVCSRELAQLKALSLKLKTWQVSGPGPFFEQVVKNEIAAQGERCEVKMNKKKLPLLVPSGILAGIIVVVLVSTGVLVKEYCQWGMTGKVKDVADYIPDGILFPFPAQDRISGGQTTGSLPLPTAETFTTARTGDELDFGRSSQGGSYVDEDLSLSGGSHVKQASREGFSEFDEAASIELYNLPCVGGGFNTEPGDSSLYYQPQEFNTEQYDRIYDNDFLQAKDNPLSTFSIDVDTASFSNVRRFLNNNQMPPKDAVRIEELINYFTYDYPQPTDNAPFSVTTELSGCPWNSGHELVLIGLQGKQIEAQNLPASNLVFLIDVSGSMEDTNKLPLLKSAFKLLVNQLRAQDKVSIVVYAGSSGLVLDSTPGDQKQTIIDAIDRLQAGGSTAGGAGIQLAYEVAKKNYLKDGNNRVILSSDGDFNIGVTNDGDLVRLIEEKRDDGIFLSVLGFGMGNYKDSRMEKLADKGNGNLAYIDNLLEAKKVFVNQLTGTLFTIAKDVKIQVEFNPANVKAYRLIGYENRLLKKEDFNDDKKDAGEIGAGHCVTALYEIVLVGSEEQFSATDELKYQQVTVKPSEDLLTVKLRYKEPQEDVSKLISSTIIGREKQSQASENLIFASAVAEFGLLLRDSPYKANASYQAVLERAKAAKGKDSDGYRAEFIKLAEIAQMLDSKNK